MNTKAEDNIVVSILKYFAITNRKQQMKFFSKVTAKCIGKSKKSWKNSQSHMYMLNS